MGNLTLSGIKSQFKSAKLRQEKFTFIFKTVISVLIYYYLGQWLNAVRSVYPYWIVSILNIIHILFYFLIFIISYYRLKNCGYKKLSWVIVFLAFVGNIEFWDIMIISILVIGMFIFTFVSKELSLKEREFYKD